VCPSEKVRPDSICWRGRLPDYMLVLFQFNFSFLSRLQFGYDIYFVNL